MKRFRISISFDGDAESIEDAINKTSALFGDLPLRNLRIDAAQMPTPPGEVVNEVETEEEEESARVSFLGLLGEDGRVRHPWEDGIYMFPQGHALHDYETMAYAQWRHDGAQTTPPAPHELMEAQRELGRGEDG